MVTDTATSAHFYLRCNTEWGFSPKYLILFDSSLPSQLNLFLEQIFKIRSLDDNICLSHLCNLEDIPTEIKNHWSVHQDAINVQYRDYLSYQYKITICIIKTVPHTSNFWISNVSIMHAALLYNIFLNAVKWQIYQKSTDKSKNFSEAKMHFQSTPSLLVSKNVFQDDFVP